MRFAALGRTQVLFDTIEALVNAGHIATLVGTAPASPEYRRREEDFARLAQRLGCDYFCDSSLGSAAIATALRAANAEVAVSVNWPLMVPAAALAAFPRGVVNAHAGDLPRYRGNACPNWAILNGEPEVVICLHAMSQELDAGPILAKSAIPLGATTYIGDVYAEIERRVPQMFVALLGAMEAGSTKPQVQDARQPMRCLARRPSDSCIAWSDPAERIARLVRASGEPFAGAWTHLEGRRVIVWRARALKLDQDYCGVPGQVVSVERSTGVVRVLCGDGMLALEVVEERAGVREPAASIVSSTRQRFGFDAIAEIERLRAAIAAGPMRTAVTGD